METVNLSTYKLLFLNYDFGEKASWPYVKK